MVGTSSLLFLAACAEVEPRASPAAGAGADGPWTFTDDLSEIIQLDKRPTRIFAATGSAAVLWDYGINAVGTMAPMTNPDGTAVRAAGRIDVSRVTSVGADEANLEALAALRPDILVMQKNLGVLDTFPVTEAQLDRARQIAPIVAVTTFGADATTVMAAYERLAVALGADLGGPEISADKERLKTAQDKLRETLAGKEGLTAAFAGARRETFSIATTPNYPDLLLYADLGLDIVKATGGDNPYFESLSWENADKYAFDVILLDDRSRSLQPPTLEKDFPTWRSLPAVKAGQVGPWNAETLPSPHGLAEAIESLNAVLEKADPAIVS